MSELKNGTYWLIGAGETEWHARIYGDGSWEQWGQPCDYNFKPLTIGPRIPTPAELALQADELARLERENAALRTGLSKAQRIICRNFCQQHHRAECIELTALLAPPTVAALVAKLPEDLQQEFARNAGEAENA